MTDSTTLRIALAAVLLIGVSTVGSTTSFAGRHRGGGAHRGGNTHRGSGHAGHTAPRVRVRSHTRAPRYRSAGHYHVGVYYGPSSYYDDEPYGYAPYASRPVFAGRFGVGLTLSRSEAKGATGAGDGIALSGRWRGHRTDLELELARQTYAGMDRIDQRIGGNAYLYLTDGALRPYLTVGAGLNAAAVGDAEVVRQGYLLGGVGLAYPISGSVDLSADLRWMNRRNLDDLPTAAVPPEEGAAEARVGVSFFF